MKKWISIFLIVGLVFSLTVPASAEKQKPTDQGAKIYDMESYYSDLWYSYNYSFEKSIYPFLTEKKLYAYQGFVDNLNNNWIIRNAVSAAASLTGEETSVEKYIEILVNIITLMEYDLNDINNHQVEIDTLKTFGDYTKDVTGMVLDSTGLPVIGKLKKLVSVTKLTFAAADITINNVAAYKHLDKMLKNYETYHYFLDVIIQYGDDDNLKKAAETLRNNVTRAMQYKLDTFNKATAKVAEFLGKDVFLDTVVLEIIKNPGNLNLNSVDQFCVDALANGYKKLNDIWGGINLSKDLGVFAADMLVGISDIMNRVAETKAMRIINDALIQSTNNYRQEIKDISDLDGIDRVYNNMRYMMYVNARGDYCLYHLISEDGRLLSLIFNDAENSETWYSQLQEIFKNLTLSLDGYYPDIENYAKDTFIQRSDADFEAYFKNNPIDKLEGNDYRYGGSMQEMGDAAVYYAGLWEDEVVWAYDQIIALSSDSRREEFLNQRDDYTKTNKSAVNKLLDEYASTGGSIDRINRAVMVRDYYKEKAKSVYRDVFNYDDKYIYFIDSKYSTEDGQYLVSTHYFDKTYKQLKKIMPDLKAVGAYKGGYGYENPATQIVYFFAYIGENEEPVPYGTCTVEMSLAKCFLPKVKVATKIETVMKKAGIKKSDYKIEYDDLDGGEGYSGYKLYFKKGRNSFVIETEKKGYVRPNDVLEVFPIK